MKINEIYAYLKELFPLETACSFDNVGLLIGDGELEVTNVLIALDCTKKIIEIAKNEGCNLIITHHPVIFDGLKFVLEGSIAHSLIKNGITVISMHTNLDMGKCGINDCLCDILGLKNATHLTAGDGYILKYGDISPISADAFANEIKEKLGGCLKYVDGGKLIEKVLVCSGAGGDFIEEALKGGFDAFITADVKHHQFLAAADNGISLFDAGHYNTEDIIVDPLKKMLAARFKEINFITTHLTDIKFSI